MGRGRTEPADLYRGPRLAAASTRPHGAVDVLRNGEFLEASQLVEEERARGRPVRTGAFAGSSSERVRCSLWRSSRAASPSSSVPPPRISGRRHGSKSTEDADFERLTSPAVNLLDSDRSLAFLLALEAHDLGRRRSRSALFTTVQRNDDFLGYSVTEGVPTGVTLVDDDTVAYATDDGRFAMVDLATGQPVTDPIRWASDRPIRSGCSSRGIAERDEGGAGGGRGDTGQIWRIDPGTGQPLSDPIETSQAIFGVAVAARLNRIAALFEDGTVAFWELVSTVPAGRSAAPSDPVPLPFVDDPDPSNGNGVGEATIDAGDGVAVDFSPAIMRSPSSGRMGSSRSGPSRATARRSSSPTGDETMNPPPLANLVYHPDGGQVVGVDPARLALHAVDAGSGAERWTSSQTA